MEDDFSRDTDKWLPEEGWENLEIIEMREGISQTKNPKYIVCLASAYEPSLRLQIDLTNIPGKRWLLRQLIEATGIEPKENKEGKKVYNWEIEDLINKTVSAQIIHDKTPFIDRNGNEIIIPKAKVVAFKKISV